MCLPFVYKKRVKIATFYPRFAFVESILATRWKELVLSVKMRPADRADASRLTTIAHAAKRHWNYPEEWIIEWREQLTVTPDYIEEHRVFAIEVDGAVAGFYALQGDGPAVELDHMWLDPQFIGQGLGRRLVEHAMVQARGAGAQRMEIDSDPHAEAFYAHIGAQRIGKTAAPVEGDEDRYLPRLSLELSD